MLTPLSAAPGTTVSRLSRDFIKATEHLQYVAQPEIGLLAFWHNAVCADVLSGVTVNQLQG
jgi:hypothetical protein